MEPLSIISLTGNVLQFIELTNKLVVAAKEISTKGSRSKLLELETIAQHVRQKSKSIQLLQPTGDSKDPPNKENPILKVSSQCTDVATELLDVLDSVRQKNSGKKWKSFFLALKSEWKAKEIEGLEARLDAIGKTLNNHLLESQLSQILRTLNQLADENHKLHAGRSDDIQALKELFREELGEKRLQRQPSQLPRSTTFLQAANSGYQYAAEQTLLGKLLFDEMDERHNSVALAHQGTFSWIFEPPTNGEAPDPQFRQWLDSSGGPPLYWIAGKPGSGKSTLMKYIYAHKEVKQELEGWADSKRLVLARFFFWSASKNTLQKSQQGLLRSLIYQILSQYPNIIRDIYPQIGQLSAANYFGDWPRTSPSLQPSPPTNVQGLADMMIKICERLPEHKLRLCLFIDGLDEYEGKPQDIVDLVQNLLRLCDVKICASSRPWNEFETSFSGGASRNLRMHDHTKQDIYAYVYDKFRNDQNFIDLQEEQEQVAQFIEEIIEAAKGVFLWVVLVVQSLRQGLTNGDRIVDLKKRLLEIPEELDDYFEKILLFDVDSRYRQQSARMFATTLKAQQWLPVMAYWFIDQECPPNLADIEVTPLKVQQINARMKQTQKRLNACCKGLLETHTQTTEDGADSLPSSILFLRKVDFLHRTVKDFLEIPKTQNILADWDAAAFKDDASICSALLWQIKTAPREYAYFEDKSCIPSLLWSFFAHAKVLNDARDFGATALERLIDELDNTLQYHGKTLQGASYVKLLYPILPKYLFGGHHDMPIGAVQFLHVCTIYGLDRYVRRKLTNIHTGKVPVHLPNLLQLALKDYNLDMVKVLVESGISPNAPVQASSCWVAFLDDLYWSHSSSQRRKRDEPMVYHCVRYLLEHGADADVVCTIVDGKQSTAREILQDIFVREDMVILEALFNRSEAA